MYYSRDVVRNPKSVLKRIDSMGDIYFINYKNSARGTGGVGTTTRAMVSLLNKLRFIYYDTSLLAGKQENYEWNLELTDIEASVFHSKYSKL